MPRFDRNGRCVAGVGDGVVSIDKMEVGRGGGACPLDDSRIIFGGHDVDGWRTMVYDAATNTTKRFSDVAAQQLVGSNGAWGVVGPNGFVGSVPVAPEWRLALALTDGRGAGDRQGAIALTHQTGLGFTIFGANGEVTEGAPGFAAYNLTVVSATQAIWPMPGGFATLNLPVPKVAGQPGRACWCDVNGHAWIVYACNGIGLIAHPTDDASMVVIIETQGLSYHYDAIALNGTIRVCYATIVNEVPESVVIRDLDLSQLVSISVVGPLPTTNVNVAPWPRKLWVAPFFSYSERYGDTAFNRYAGNAITVVPDERDPQASIIKELNRIRPLGQAMIVASGDYDIPDVNVDQTIAWWASAGNAKDLGRAVGVALKRPEKPVIAYMDGDDWPLFEPVWISQRVWPSVQAYRFPNEPLIAFQSRVERVLGIVEEYEQPIVLTPRFDDFNGDGSIRATLECMPLYEKWIRLYRVVVIMPFADRRGMGMAKVPDLYAWGKAFLDAVPARPNRNDYWLPSGDIIPVLRNKLQQSTNLLTFTDTEKAFLLARL